MGDRYALHCGDCIDVLRTLADSSVDSVVTDPPYELGFMGKAWDASGIAYSVELWREALRVLKPGGHLLAFSGSRTYHRMTCAIEDAGFDIRDSIMWIYGSGFPKSLDVSKAIDKAAGAEREVIGQRDTLTGSDKNANTFMASPRLMDVTAPATDAARDWSGWGTALKPAHEPICVARKPLIGTVAANVLAHGTGALNIDGCRVGNEGGTRLDAVTKRGDGIYEGGINTGAFGQTVAGLGRWPANVIHDGSPEVLAGFPDSVARPVKAIFNGGVSGSGEKLSEGYGMRSFVSSGYADTESSAARFFYCPKASKRDRDEGLDAFENKFLATMGDGIGAREHNPDQPSAWRKNSHPTVKPTDLMRYLVRLVTPNGGVCLDPFAGSGSTGKASALEGFRFIGIEREPDYVAIANARITHALGMLGA